MLSHASGNQAGGPSKALPFGTGRDVSPKVAPGRLRKSLGPHPHGSTEEAPLALEPLGPQRQKRERKNARERRAAFGVETKTILSSLSARRRKVVLRYDAGARKATEEVDALYLVMDAFIFVRLFLPDNRPILSAF